MLPRYPRIERLRHGFNMRIIEMLAAQVSPMMGQIKKHRQFEGSEATIIRHDDTIGDVAFKGMRATLSIPEGSVEDFDESALADCLLAVAQQIGNAFDQHLVEVLHDTTEQTGNVIQAGGQPLTPDLILQALESMPANFDEAGNYLPPTLMVPPGVFERLKSEQNGEVKERYDRKVAEIIERKRVEYSGREASRVLAG